MTQKYMKRNRTKKNPLTEHFGKYACFLSGKVLNEEC